MKKTIFTTLFALFYAVTAFSQPRHQQVEILLLPDSPNAIYKTGEKAKIKIIALECGVALSGAEISYQISEDLQPIREEKTIKLKGNEGEINIGTMKNPGYLRVKATCKKNGKTYSNMCTVSFSPDKLTPVTPQPKDFKEFWSNNLKLLEGKKLDARMELIGKKCTDEVNVYHISYRNYDGSRMYGMLTMPAKEGKYPVILRFPGAGVGEKGGDIAHAAKGAIILEMGIHAIPVNLDGEVYTALSEGLLADYPTINFDNRDTYYYKRVYLGCVQGIDFLLSLPQCNGNIGTFGGSQGGALSIVTSALDKRIKASVAYFPALCDMEGYIHGRAGGWPHIFKNEGNRTKEIINAMRYYDVSNFARELTSPIYYLYGYNDITCAPTTTRSTYNVIRAPKQLIIGEDIGHWTYPEQMNTLWDWIINELKKNKL